MVLDVSPEEAAALRARAEAKDAALNKYAHRLDEIALELKQLHEDVQDGLRQTLHRAMRAGELLTEAKLAAGHRRWLPWVSTHCAFSEDTAQLYMKLFRHRDEILKHLKTEPGRYLTLRDTLKAVSPSRAAASSRTTPIKSTTASEKRISALKEAWHDAEPAERKKVLAAVQALDALTPPSIAADEIIDIVSDDEDYGEDVPEPGHPIPPLTRMRGFLNRARESAEMARADDLRGLTITAEAVDAAREDAEAWHILSLKLERRLATMS
jgi:hypothetical protein